MRKMLINATRERGHGLHELRVAIIQANGKLDYLDIERPSQKQIKSNIYKGIITSIEPSLAAVFVNYGAERHGFLPFKEISREYYITDVSESQGALDIHKVLRVGQEVVIQVDKEERGTKGAALTTFISLAGSYLVLMPNNPAAGGISRRIEGDDRDKLRDVLNQLTLPEGMGIIVRTAGMNKNLTELQWDLDLLLKYWEAVKQAAIAKQGPYLIHQESDVIMRAVRDYLRPDIHEIIVDDQEAYKQISQYLQPIRPDFLEHLKLYSHAMPLFSHYAVEPQIEAAYQREIRLPSGGSIVIDQTEALVSVDINSARSTHGKSIEETALHTNLEAADEIARQLRIRDIGGLIVIDFIDMTPVKNQREVEDRLRDALNMDRARIQTTRISRFGLLEMSRQRLRTSLAKNSQNMCPVCLGRGAVRDAESLALSIIHAIQERAARDQNVQIQVQVPVEIATVLMNEKRNMINEVEANQQVEVLVIPNIHLQAAQFHIETVKASQQHGGSASYELVKQPVVEVSAKRFSEQSEEKTEEPVINQFLSPETMTADRAASPTKAVEKPGLLKRIFKALFAGKPASTSAKTSEEKSTQSNQDRRSSYQRDDHRRGSRPGGRDFRRGDRRDRNDRNDRNDRGTRRDRPERTGEQRNERGDFRGRRPRNDHHSRRPFNPNHQNAPANQAVSDAPADTFTAAAEHKNPIITEEFHKPREHQPAAAAPSSFVAESRAPEVSLPTMPKQASAPRARSAPIVAPAQDVSNKDE